MSLTTNPGPVVAVILVFVAVLLMWKLADLYREARNLPWRAAAARVLDAARWAHGWWRSLHPDRAAHRHLAEDAERIASPAFRTSFEQFCASFGTIPVKQVGGRPPWETAPVPRAEAMAEVSTDG